MNRLRAPERRKPLRGAALRSTPEKRREWLYSRKPINRVSARRRKFNRELAKVRPLVEARSGGRCEAGLPVCTGRAQEIHHKAGRVGKLANHPANLLAVCRPCHDAIGASPSMAVRHGLSNKRVTA